jgi:hypothetical protein
MAVHGQAKVIKQNTNQITSSLANLIKHSWHNLQAVFYTMAKYHVKLGFFNIKYFFLFFKTHWLSTIFAIV